MGRRSIFITGAARGIGQACAERFATAGWFVGGFDRDADALDQAHAALMRGHGPSFAARSCYAALDVTEPESIQAGLATFAAASGGNLDVVVNNAGVMHVGRFETLDAAAHRQTVAVNLQGVIDVAHASFELLRDTPGARLINLSSAAAIYGTPEMASYSATKHAVRGLTEALEIEWARHDIRVSDVMPGFVATELLSATTRLHAEGVIGVHLQPEQVAAVVWQAATSRRRRTHWPVGWQAIFAHHARRLTPDAVERRVLGWMAGMR